jgi:hypothetical protein
MSALLRLFSQPEFRELADSEFERRLTGWQSGHSTLGHSTLPTPIQARIHCNARQAPRAPLKAIKYASIEQNYANTRAAQ